MSPPQTASLLDRDHPWPALSSFDEDGQQFFNGRSNEIAALHRLVQQGRLVVLFGQSGLGKTSLLQAGLFPVLRLDHYLPTHVRLDFDDDTAPLIEQLAAHLQREVARHDMDAPAFDPGESLWHYLHRSGLEMWSSTNHLVTPVFVLDQFEEVFTLGDRHPDAIARLRVDLADLVENRLPASVIRNEADLGALRVERQSYKVVLSFREDFLPAFEGWKQSLPSLLHNRLRLLPLNGEEAFKAVHDSAPHLTDRATAEAIVRFVTRTMLDHRGTAASAPQPMESLADLDVEPALLSLMCHGLNERRLAAGKTTIDGALLQGAGASILEDFYVAALADSAPSVSRFIEEELITEGGFRKLCAIDDARKYDVSREQLALLVDRRLLRMEPYHGIERVELIHDVLTKIVRDRRDVQRRIARDTEAERHARQRRRLYSLSGGLVVAFLVLIAVGWLAWVARQQAQRAQTATRIARAGQLAAQGEGRLELEPDLALLLGIESLRIAPTPAGESLLRQAIPRLPEATLADVATSSEVDDNVSIVDISLQGTSAVAARDGSVAVYDRAGQRQHSLQPGKAKPSALAFSRDGRHLAVATGDGTVSLWDAGSGSQVRRTTAALSRRKEDPGDSPISDIVFHPTEPVVAVTGGDGLISLWNTETDTFTPLESFSPDDVVAIWFDSSGRLKAINDSAHVITWDVRKPAARPLGELIKGIDAPVRAAVVNPLNENLMAIATGDRDIISIVQGLRAETLPGRTMILPFVDGKPPAPPFRELTGGNAASVQSLAFDHTGTFLWTGGAGGDICVWTTGQRELTRTLRAHRGSVNALRASRDGRSMLSAGADGTARVWAASPLPATLLEGLKGQVGALAVGPRGEWVVGGDQNGTIRAWDASGKERWTAKHKDALSALAVSRDGSLIASAGGQALGSGRNPGGDTAIRLWNARDGQLIREIANREDVLGAAFSADSKFLLTAGIAPGVQVWDVASGKVVRQMTTADAQPSMQLGLSGNGRIVAVGDGRNTILIWQYETAARLKDIKLPKNQMTSGSALDETGRLLLVTSFSSTDAELFDTADGRRIRRFALGGSGANGTDLSHNGVLAVTANISGPPALWDLASGRVLASLAPAFGAWHVLFSSDARRIAVSSSDGSIFLLECTFCVASGDLLKLAAARATRTFTDEERRTFLSDESPLPGSTRVP